jgi:hypothetical protein
MDWPYLATAHRTYGWFNLVAYRADQSREWPPNRYPDVITITKDSRKRLNQGGWSTKQGERHYWLQLFEHGKAVQPSVYDAHGIPTELIENLYSLPAPSTSPLKVAMPNSNPSAQSQKLL